MRPQICAQCVGFPGLGEEGGGGGEGGGERGDKRNACYIDGLNLKKKKKQQNTVHTFAFSALFLFFFLFRPPPPPLFFFFLNITFNVTSCVSAVRTHLNQDIQNILPEVATCVCCVSSPVPGCAIYHAQGHNSCLQHRSTEEQKELVHSHSLYRLSTVCATSRAGCLKEAMKHKTSDAPRSLNRVKGGGAHVQRASRAARA